jgi:hypothetical protein
MKSLLLEILLVTQAILFWALALPAAAVFFVFATLWRKISTLFPRESFPPAGAGLYRASA